jgi:hypothetical protein
MIRVSLGAGGFSTWKPRDPPALVAALNAVQDGCSGLRDTRSLGQADGEPAINEQGHFGFNGLVEVAMRSHEHRLRGTLDGLSRPLHRKGVRVKSTGEVLETFEVTDDDDPQGKRYIVDVKSITARDRFVLDEHPDTGGILKAEIRESAFKKLVRPKGRAPGPDDALQPLRHAAVVPARAPRRQAARNPARRE